LIPPLAVPDREQSDISLIDESVTVLVDKPRSLAHARSDYCEVWSVDAGISGKATTSVLSTLGQLYSIGVVFVHVFEYNSGMNSGELSTIGADPTAADLALDVLSTDLDHLIKIVEDGGLEGYDNAGLIGFMQSFERLRNRLPLIDHRVIIDAQRRNLADALTQRGLNRVLVQSLRLSPGEAARRVHAAEAVGERVSMLGQPLDPIRPLLGVAQRAGDVSPEQVQLIVKALASVDRPGFDSADVNEGERLLTGSARKNCRSWQPAPSLPSTQTARCPMNNSSKIGGTSRCGRRKTVDSAENSG
jgi:hypothetical protein